MNNINRLIIIVGITTSTIPYISNAREISYDYVQGSFSSITNSRLATDVDGTSFAFSGSFSITPNVAFVALFGTTSFDRVAGIEVDATELDFGITAHTSIAPSTDATFNFSVVNADIEATDGFSTASTDDTGNSIGIGIRHMLNESTEVSGGFNRVDIFDDSATTFGAGLRFYTDNKLSIGIGYSSGDDVDALILNARIDH